MVWIPFACAILRISPVSGVMPEWDMQHTTSFSFIVLMSIVIGVLDFVFGQGLALLGTL